MTTLTKQPEETVTKRTQPKRKKRNAVDHTILPDITVFRLSSREIEILVLICHELTPSEISQRLKISEKTFFNHRANILEKTGCKGNLGLLKLAYRYKLLEVVP